MSEMYKPKLRIENDISIVWMNAVTMILMTTMLTMIKTLFSMWKVAKCRRKYLFSILLFYFQFLHAYAMSDKINLHMNRILFSNVSFWYQAVSRCGIAIAVVVVVASLLLFSKSRIFVLFNLCFSFVASLWPISWAVLPSLIMLSSSFELKSECVRE